MGREPVLADLGHVHQSALDHVPAERALGAAEHEDQRETRHQPAAHAAAHDEPDEGEEEHQPDQPAPDPVDVLPPEDAAELRDRHARVDLEILRRRAIEIEDALPVRIRERRQESHDRPPFDDGQPRARQAGDAADDDHGHHHGGADKEPDSDRAVGGLACGDMLGVCVHGKGARFARNLAP